VKTKKERTSSLAPARVYGEAFSPQGIVLEHILNDLFLYRVTFVLLPAPEEVDAFVSFKFFGWVSLPANVADVITEQSRLVADPLMG